MKKLLSFVSFGYILFGVGMLIFVGVKIVQIFEFGASDPNFSIFSAHGIPTLSLGLIGLLLFGLACWVGRLLFQCKNRKTATILSIVLLLGFPFGTVLGVVTLCLLQTKEVKHAFED